ncbi:rhodanese-like domain-containing protein [Rhodospira trueperi]|uniref:Rhodanese-related sulfurtransferase n=1 Tax=Rhodospira trueperi TaxID=69960 RepID=A0A1G7F2A8_9PROT|nr:rhodanese-like domain-containing protein [Rhodospira trueperi]SDE69876.1 Rhodanese-related sulfurtransferase [Rhodospira trueperi]
MDGLNFISMDFLLPVLIGMGAVLLFRMMPRLMAGGVPFVAPVELRKRLDQGDDVLVLDVRTSREFSDRHGHIPGALNLPLDQLGQRLGEVSADLRQHQDTPVFIVCQTSSRAAHAARLFRKAGFRNLSIISGGMSAWRSRGLPTQKR